jgi:hypothetical protein
MAILKQCIKNTSNNTYLWKDVSAANSGKYFSFRNKYYLCNGINLEEVEEATVKTKS